MDAMGQILRSSVIRNGKRTQNYKLNLNFRILEVTVPFFLPLRETFSDHWEVKYADEKLPS